MSKYIVGFVVGFGLSALLVGVAVLLQVDRWWLRDDRRGVPLLGVIVAGAQLLGELTARVIDKSVTSLNLEGVTERSREVVLVAVVVFALVGLIEDLLARSRPGGHFGVTRSLPPFVLARRLIISLGAAVGTVAYLWKGDFGSEALIDVALIFFCANVFVVLNTKPARTAKVALAAIAAAMLGSLRSPDLAGVSMVAGSTAALGLGELAGKLALGSAGAAAIGAAIGVGVAMVSSSSVSAVVAAFAAFVAWMAQTGRLETVFSDGPLETFDRLGQ